ncbi:TIGR02117 family protein [Pseudahrensia aquimaris]|uniref:TIGR02117 family protein n=1 Tax=Pseudahrensia aquimaris TaxID=744461 RepID=A0ABW3FBL6_9HYPH
MKLCAGIIAVPAVYLFAAWIGAYAVWPTTPHADIGAKTHRIHLLTGLLHTDIAVEATPEVLERFAFLRETPVPLENPNLRNLVFGWGSQAFYTTAGTYADIEPAAVFTAVTGDNSVMRVVGYGQIKSDETVVSINLSTAAMERLLLAIERGFSNGTVGKPRLLPGATIGPNDAFFEGAGHFNIFYPCNQWVRDVLVETGFILGRWTPTTHSLITSIKAHNQELLSRQP